MYSIEDGLAAMDTDLLPLPDRSAIFKDDRTFVWGRHFRDIRPE